MKIKTIEMDVSTFIKIPSNPIERDIKIHADSAKQHHLATPAVTHAKVAIAKCKNQTWKLDGHTRAFLWKSKELKAPKILNVDVYYVKDKAEVIELHSHFDNSKAAETIPDKVAGAFRFLRIINYNKFAMRGAGIVNGLQALSGALNLYVPRQDVLKLLIPWEEELRVFVNQHWVSNSSHGKPGVPSAATLAFLVTIKMYKNDSLGFWDSYYNNSTIKSIKSGRSGCQAAIDWIIKARKDELITGRQNTLRNAEALIKAYHFYRAKKTVNKLSELYSRKGNHSFSSQFGEFLKDIGFPVNDAVQNSKRKKND